MADDAATGTAPVAHLAEERDVAEAEVAGDLDLFGGLECVRREPVDFPGRDAGVVERELDGLQGEALLGPVEPLGELRLPDPRDRGPVADHRVTASASRATTPF